jgi:hypothetical protein
VFATRARLNYSNLCSCRRCVSFSTWLLCLLLKSWALCSAPKILKRSPANSAKRHCDGPKNSKCRSACLFFCVHGEGGGRDGWSAFVCPRRVRMRADETRMDTRPSSVHYSFLRLYFVE